MQDVRNEPEEFITNVEPITIRTKIDQVESYEKNYVYYLIGLIVCRKKLFTFLHKYDNFYFWKKKKKKHYKKIN